MVLANVTHLVSHHVATKPPHPYQPTAADEGRRLTSSPEGRGGRGRPRGREGGPHTLTYTRGAVLVVPAHAEVDQPLLTVGGSVPGPAA